MGRIAGLANTIRNSGARLGPLDAVFAGADYIQGKSEGEDDTRAIAGAAGSTLGGWGGAVAGASAGAAIGSVVPVIGTAIGGAAGAIIGGSAGGFLGGWGADRTDELIRGNKKDNNMAKYYDQYGNYVGEDGIGDAVANNAGGLLAGGAALYGGKQLYDTVRANNPLDQYRTAVTGGIDRSTAARAAAGQLGDNFMGKAGKVVKPLMIGAALNAADDLLLGGGIKRTVGNAVGGGIDAITGGRTNFDGNVNDARVMAAQKQDNQQMRYQQTAGQAQSDAALAAMYNNPDYRFINEQNEKNYRRMREQDDYVFNRNRNANKEQQRYQLAAQSAVNLMDHWQESSRNVANAMNVINNARLI